MRWWLKSIFVPLMLVCHGASVQAHEGRPIHIEVLEAGSGDFQLRWKIPPVFRESELPSVSLSGGQCEVASPRAAALQGALQYRCAQSPTAIDISFPGYNPALSVLLDVRLSSGARHLRFTGPEDRRIPLPAEQDFAAVAGQYAVAGFSHIIEGFDHLLFVFCLLLLVGSVKRIIWAVTGFTLGHSLTLGLTALYGWSLPAAYVEPLIAFSIALMAAEKLVADANPKQNPPFIARFPAVMASLFGLLHGFGFGGALSDIGLPYDYKLTALAFFNIGVEVGQLLFVLVVLAITMVLRRVQLQRFLAGFAKPSFAAYPAGLIAGYWTIERVAGVWV